MHKMQADCNRLVLLPIVHHIYQDASKQPSPATLLVTAIVERAARFRPVTTSPLAAASDLPARLRFELEQGRRHVLLVPWGLQLRASELINELVSTLHPASEWQLHVETVQRPTIELPGVSPAGPLGGLLHIQQRLDHFVARLPGWHTAYTRIRTQQASILLLSSPHALTDQQAEKEFPQLEKALLSVLSTNKEEQGVPGLDTMLLKDTRVYTGYLLKLLQAVIDLECEQAICFP
jgi:hypothetical protein